MRIRLPLLCVAAAMFPVCVLFGFPQTAAGAPAVFSVHPEDHRVFLYNGKPTIVSLCFHGDIVLLLSRTK